MNKKKLFLILLATILAVPFITLAASAPDTFCGMIKKIRDLTYNVGGSMVIVGWVITGILYLTAGGGSRLEVAKKALIACVIGTVLVIIATSATSIIKDAIGTGDSTECTMLQGGVNYT